MKQGFQILGILTLVVGSFLYSERVDTVSKLSDDLLKEIKDKSENYKIEKVSPIITDDTFIPGKNGKEVDINKSYEKMREIGYFYEKSLVYKNIKVKPSLSKNKDKFIISANRNEKNIALLFKVKNNYNLNKILSILDKNKIKGTFFIESVFLEKNYNVVYKLIKEGHTVGNLSKNEDYNNTDFVWVKTLVTNMGNQKDNYCYAKNKDKNILKRCYLEKSYTIIPTKIIDKRPLSNIKESLSKGALISLETNESLDNEIENIVNYIISKGYKIKSLENVLKE